MPNPKKPTSTTQAALVKSPATAAPRPFPIVGIGASAGGLEALEQFFAHVAPASSMAFVVIQHLDPTQPGMLPELLQRATAMPVLQAKNRMKVMPDHVYVIPPNRDLSILHDRLCLLEPVAPRGLRLPIDFSFAPWLTTGASTRLASSSPAWVRTARWAYARSRSSAAWF